PANPDDPNAGNEYNILVMGSDSREGDNQDIGGGDFPGMRSDTTLLVHIAADRSRVDVVSIPRDLVVDIPSCTLPDGTETQPRLEGQGWSDQDRMWNVPFFLGGSTGDVAAAAACTWRKIGRASCRERVKHAGGGGRSKSKERTRTTTTPGEC